MEPIQINVTVKLDDVTQAFLSSLFQSVIKPTASVPVEQPKLVSVKPADPVEPTPAKPAEQPKPAAVSAQSSITIDSLRELAMTKMNAHRVEIKQKLTELGTPSITKLDASKYQEMFEFLKKLS